MANLGNGVAMQNRGYRNHREYLVAAISGNRYQAARTDPKMDEKHRAVCRRILRRQCGELDDLDAAEAERKALPC